MNQTDINELNQKIADIEGIQYHDGWPIVGYDFTGFIKGKDGIIQSCKFDGSRSRAGWLINEIYTPATDWSQAGPLIEKYNIAIERAGDGWCALFDDTFCFATYKNAKSGATPLIAAMRAIVAKLS